MNSTFDPSPAFSTARAACSTSAVLRGDRWVSSDCVTLVIATEVFSMVRLEVDPVTTTVSAVFSGAVAPVAWPTSTPGVAGAWATGAPDWDPGWVPAGVRAGSDACARALVARAAAAHMASAPAETVCNRCVFIRCLP